MQWQKKFLKMFLIHWLLFNEVLLNGWDVMIKVGGTRSQKKEFLLKIEMLANIFYCKKYSSWKKEELWFGHSIFIKWQPGQQMEKSESLMYFKTIL